MQAFGQFSSVSSFPETSSTEDGWKDLEDLSRRASRAAEEDVGVRRALNGVFVGHVDTVVLKVISGETGAIRSVHLRQDRRSVLLKPFESSLR